LSEKFSAEIKFHKIGPRSSSLLNKEGQKVRRRIVVQPKVLQTVRNKRGADQKGKEFMTVVVILFAKHLLNTCICA
jgi:hypothetical protein